MNKFLSAEKTSNVNKTRTDSAKKSLENYLNQLKFHFELDNEEVVKILETVLKSEKGNCLIKKLWHIWK